MSEPLPFCKIKLQYLLEMVSDHQLNDNALRVALYLSLAHADHKTGESHPSFETIGAAIGKHAKSVKRAVNGLEEAGYMTVVRGTNKGNSSRYRPTEAAIMRATSRRKEGDKIVLLNRTKGGQNRLRSRTVSSSEGGQDRPPNREQELKRELGSTCAQDLPKARQNGPYLVFVPGGGGRLERDWDDCLRRHGIRALSRCLPEVRCEEGRRGYMLPALGPAPKDSELLREQIEIVESLVDIHAAERRQSDVA
ncbi:helix-turn-helix domain-containing protein [Ruegeria sp. A3M17]|uniref:helix-turn-helix domain-containing protein n=1 Tax=Ruegeria sp. A3M17 TaxID=2267229 RepID=UPI000DE9E1C7|nr:helix-turn-helix domain-containing protein [Ruegeria sp. A3M17]RBW54771.1 hypothetical protein DS906_14600 [Ruegeria sp. A3M17]